MKGSAKTEKVAGVGDAAGPGDDPDLPRLGEEPVLGIE